MDDLDRLLGFNSDADLTRWLLHPCPSDGGGPGRAVRAGIAATARPQRAWAAGPTLGAPSYFLPEHPFLPLARPGLSRPGLQFSGGLLGKPRQHAAS